MVKFSDNIMAGIVWDDITLTLGTLGNKTATGTNSKIDAARLQGFRVLRTEWQYVALG